MKKAIKIVGVILLIVVTAFIALIVYLSKQPVVPKNYARNIPAGG